jgi:hypothetical protein
VAALYLHMADLWHRIPDEELRYVTERFAAHFKGHREYYTGQPAEIRELTPPPGRPDFYYLRPDDLFRRACDADPCSENFQRWLHWARQWLPRSESLIAERWMAALPQDIPPVLHLMQLAEKTNALKRAFKFMELAERLDGLNPEVRRARLRLLISLATRHLQQKKTHLAEPELRQIEALPQAQQGDRPVLAAALRWVYWTLRGETAQADEARARVVSLMGSETAGQMVLKAVASACKLKERVPEAKSAAGPLAAALGRACALGEDTGLPIVIPPALSSKLQRELSGRDVTADAVGLAALGEAALRADDLELAYAVSAAGLKLTQEKWAGFLFLRARALPDWEEERQALCAAGASELSRRQRNADLLRRIAEWREEEMIGMQGSEADVAMSTEQVNTLVQRELKERGFPDFPDGSRDYDSPCDCPVCRANRQELPPALEQMMEEIGPEELIKAMGEMLRGGGLKPKRRRRSRRVFDSNELPF